ncbi:virion core protein [Orf virus]|uniref:25 kDa core protein OPG138 n=1 Tax=Orf virus TaxID=10258 RepID=A0A0F6N1U3_ORFV|nr:virion core protein [Orf virus]ASY92384.1 virion core protein [Orf virus]
MASEKMAQRPQSSYDDYVSTLQKIAPQLRSLLTQLNNEQVIRGGATSSEVDCVGGAGALEASSSTRRGSSSSSSSRKRTTGTRSTGSRSTGSRSSGTRSSGSTRSRRSGAPSRRNNDGTYGGMNACDDNETTIQAVSNCGKIVYGVVKNGKLDVQGTVGEVCEDLLGIDSVNGGRKKSSSGRSGTGTSRRSGTGTGRSGTSGTSRRSTTSGTSSSASSSRRASSGNTPCSTTSSASTGARRRASNLMNAMDLDGGMC